MEANIFRQAVRELRGRIVGIRVEKVFSPARGTWTLDLGREGYLVFFASRSRGFFFLSTAKPDNPAAPSGQAMWFRKRLRGRRVLEVVSWWQHRRMAWKLSPGPGNWLVFDCRTGPALVDELEPGFGTDPEWPAIEEVRTGREIWKQYPQLSPPLRHFVQNASPEQAGEVWDRLRTGEVNRFFLMRHSGKEARLLPWLESGPDVEVREYDSALLAAEAYGAPRVVETVTEAPARQTAFKRRRKKLLRGLDHLTRDEDRLRNMIAESRYGELIRANLYRLDGASKPGELTIMDPGGEPVRIELPPGSTVTRAMQHFFKRAEKGKRGIPFVRERRGRLEKELAELVQAGVAPPESAPAGKKGTRETLPSLPAKYRKMAVHVYRSDDGFLIVRGKNQKANHQLLSQVASPFDLWFHTEGGPGAHVILKRDFAAQEVPERTMEQAAVLAGLAGWQRDAGRAGVICALVRDVRKVKGAALGRVIVDVVRQSLQVPLDPDLESRLRSTLQR
jgi:predicted ribosome quality control (RQC) complex YloA/Tae2 family protein